MRALMKHPNIVKDWDGPVCWNEFEDCADSVEEAAQDYYDQYGYSEGPIIMQCCAPASPHVPGYLAESVIEWIDDCEENCLASGKGLIQSGTTEEQRADLQALIENWVKGLDIKIQKWAEGNPEIDIEPWVKKLHDQETTKEK